MDTLVQADIFFFITSIAISLVTIAMLMALFVLFQILRDIRYTSKRIREETDRIISDVDDLREFVKKEGKRAFNIKELVSGVLHIFQKKKRVRRGGGKEE